MRRFLYRVRFLSLTLLLCLAFQGNVYKLPLPFSMFGILDLFIFCVDTFMPEDRETVVDGLCEEPQTRWHQGVKYQSGWHLDIYCCLVQSRIYNLTLLQH